MAEDLTYRLNDFEGPLDLLLHLIKVNEMDIMDIPIVEITAQYLASSGRTKLGYRWRVLGDGCYVDVN